MKSIKSIKVFSELDTNYCPDHLGRFSSERGQFAIRHDEGNPRTYDWFNADNVENMKQARENYKEYMKFENNDLWAISIHAKAVILTGEHANRFGELINIISSGGLYGIERGFDDDNKHDKQVGKEQLEELSEVLIELGFTQEEIDKSDITYEL